MAERRVLSYKKYYSMSGDEFQPGDIVDVHLTISVGRVGEVHVTLDPTGQSTPEETVDWGDRLEGQRGQKVAEGLCPTIVSEFKARRSEMSKKLERDRRERGT